MSNRRTASLNIGYLEPDQVSLWDAFVDRSPEGTFFHHAGWKRVIEQSLGIDVMSFAHRPATKFVACCHWHT